MFSIYNNVLRSSTTLVLKGEKKHVSKLLLMDTDTAKTAMTDWRAQALSLKTKQDSSSLSENAGGVAATRHPAVC